MGKFGAGTMMAVIFATVLGLGGAYAVREYLNRPEPEEEESPPPVRTFTVPTAASDLPPGRVLTINDIVPLRFTAETFKKSRYNGKVYMSSPAQLKGRMLKVAIRKGESFNPSIFYPDNEGPGIDTAKLEDGKYTAKILEIKNLPNLSGMVKPTSFVDIFYRSKKPEITVPLLERVEVLAVGSATLATQKMPENAKTLTIKVTPYQAQMLQVVEGKGDLTIVLRSPNDFAKRAGGGPRVTLGQLLGLPTGIARRTMDIYNGGKKDTMVFNQKLVYNPDLYIPTPIPEEEPARLKKKRK